MVNLTILGISLQGESQAPVLLLHSEDTDQVLSLLIGPMEAFAISSGLSKLEGKVPAIHQDLPKPSPDDVENQKARRPMTHDLLLSIMHSLGGVLNAVEILGVKDGVYIAEAVISAPSGEVRIDCRPSDGVALAVRCNAVIRAKKSVLVYGDKMETVLANLPEHLRALVEANIGEEQDPKNITIKVTLDCPELGLFGAEVEAEEKTPGKPPNTINLTIRNPRPEPKVISGAIPKTSLSAMTIMSSLGDNATEDERWAELLKQISPENKEIM